MATAQPSRAKGQAARRTGEQPRGGEQVERDENYNLIAVLYRSLREVERHATYCQDAEESGDSELLEFFQEMRETHKEMAAKARELLTERMLEAGHGQSGEEEEEEDEGEEEPED